MAAESRSRTLLASGARTTTLQGTSDVVACNARQLIIVVDITDVSASPSITVTIKGSDPTSGKTWNILASAALVAAATTRLYVTPHLTAAANSIAQDVVPPFIQVVVTHNNANSGTYSVGMLECV